MIGNENRPDIEHKQGYSMKDYKAENERLKIEIRKVWADYLASDFETCCEMDNFLDGLEKLVELANED